MGRIEERLRDQSNTVNPDGPAPAAKKTGPIAAGTLSEAPTYDKALRATCCVVQCVWAVGRLYAAASSTTMFRGKQIHARTHARKHARTHARTHAHTRTRTRTYTHTHSHIHTCFITTGTQADFLRQGPGQPRLSRLNR